MKNLQEKMSDRRKLTDLLVDISKLRGEYKQQKMIELKVGIERYQVKYSEAWTPRFFEVRE